MGFQTCRLVVSVRDVAHHWLINHNVCSTGFRDFKRSNSESFCCPIQSVPTRRLKANKQCLVLWCNLTLELFLGTRLMMGDLRCSKSGCTTRVHLNSERTSVHDLDSQWPVLRGTSSLQTVLFSNRFREGFTSGQSGGMLPARTQHVLRNWDLVQPSAFSVALPPSWGWNSTPKWFRKGLLKGCMHAWKAPRNWKECGHLLETLWSTQTHRGRCSRPIR